MNTESGTINKEALLSFLSTEAAAMVLCRRCGRPLTDPKSIAGRIGPVCAAEGDATDVEEEE